MKEKIIMNVIEVAKYLDINRETVYRLAREGKIPAFKIGYDWRFHKKSIDKWIADKERFHRNKKKDKKEQKKVNPMAQKKFTNMDIERGLRAIVAKVSRSDESKVRDETNLRDELGLDSLNAMEILAAIETKYGIQIDEAKAFDIVTARDLYETVKSYLNG